MIIFLRIKLSLPLPKLRRSYLNCLLAAHDALQTPVSSVALNSSFSKCKLSRSTQQREGLQLQPRR